SHGVADDFSELTGFPRSRVDVLNNPVVTPALVRAAKESVDHPWFQPGEVPVVIGVGRLVKQKDFESLIRAFGKVREKRVCRLVIFGEGEQRPYLAQLIEHLGLEDAIDLPGFADPIFPYMAKASAFVLSSRWEGLPGVLIQAMACGCPVIATDCPSGPREILKGGELGVLVSVGGISGLSRAILEVLERPRRETSSLIERANDYGLEPMLDRYIEILGL